MKHLLIRHAVKLDLQFISRLQQQWLEEDSVYGFVPDSEEAIESRLGPYFLIAESGDELIGFISGSIHLSEGTAVIAEGESYLELDNLYVRPEYRRQGVGSSLMTQLLARAKEQGVSNALLYSAVKDLDGILGFYRKHDFQSWYIQMFKKL